MTLEFDQSYHLAVSDVKVDSHLNPTRMKVCIKTDPFRQDFWGATQRMLCPVETVLDFLVMRGYDPGPLFKFQDEKFLTRTVFVAKLQVALSAAGLSREEVCGLQL